MNQRKRGGSIRCGGDLRIGSLLFNQLGEAGPDHRFVVYDQYLLHQVYSPFEILSRNRALTRSEAIA